MNPSRRYAVAPILGGVELLSAIYRHHRFTPHSHDYAVIGVVQQGDAVVFGGGQRLLMHKGSVLVIPPHVLHDSYNIGIEAWHYRALYLNIEQITTLTDGRAVGSDVLGSRPFVLDDAAIAERVCAVHETLSNVEALMPADVLGEMSALFATLDVAMRERPGNSTGDHTISAGVARVRHAIDAEPLRFRTLTEMAVFSGLNRFSFAHAFARAYGVAPHKYASQRRMATVRRLLMAGESITHAAHQAGFADQSHLTRRFISVFGVAPGEFQRAWRDTRTSPLARTHITHPS